MPNVPIITQAATLLNAVVEQQTGQAQLAPINNVQDFISVANTALLTGKDPVINAISQVLTRTIYASRPYNQPLASLAIPAERYGNIIRKLSPVAREVENDEAFEWPAAFDSTQTGNPYGDGESVDQYKIRKQRVIQTNFYGSAVYEQAFTIFERQFDVAFQSPDEFMRFMSMLTVERRNERESYEEGKARLIQANFIAGILSENNNDRVIHLLTEYNTLTGQSLTATSVMQAANFESFIRWMYSRVRSIIGLFRSRSQKYQTVLSEGTVLRHTEPENVRVALYRPFMEMINSMVLAGLYNADMMRLPTYEAIDFWQSINTPQAINIAPVYTGANGAPVTGEAVNNNTVIGVIHDRDAFGYAMRDVRVNVSPYNAAGDYWNEFHKARFTAISDNTEKAVVLCLD